LIYEHEEGCDLDRSLRSSGRCELKFLANGKQRRLWSADDRTRILAETFALDAKVSDVARKHRIAASLIFAWRREARAKELGVATAPGLVPVYVAAPRATTVMQSPPPEEPPHPVRSMAKETGLIEIDLENGKRVRVDTDVDADALGQVLDVLERR